MVNAGLGPGGERGEEAAAMKKRWHFTAIIHPCFVPAALRTVCTGMECRAEGCWDGGMNGAGCGERRGGRGGDWGFERWRSHGVKVWDTYEERIRETKASVFLPHYLTFNPQELFFMSCVFFTFLNVLSRSRSFSLLLTHTHIYIYSAHTHRNTHMLFSAVDMVCLHNMVAGRRRTAKEGQGC